MPCVHYMDIPVSAIAEALEVEAGWRCCSPRGWRCPWKGSATRKKALRELQNEPYWIKNQNPFTQYPFSIGWDRGNSKLLLFNPRVMTLRVMNLRVANLRVVNLRVMNIRVMTRIRVFQFMPRNRVRVKSPQINDSCIPYLFVLVCGSPTPMLSLEGPVPGSISSECRVSRFQQSTFRSPNRGEGSNGVHFGDSQVL